MAGLLDIAPLTETVTVRGQTLQVGELSGSAIVRLLARFPELRMMMTGKKVELDRLLEIGGEAIAAIIAAGCGSVGDEDAERVAGSLGAEVQAEILGVILRLTMPNGAGPFAQKLVGLAKSLNPAGARSAKVPDTKSPKPSRS